MQRRVLLDTNVLLLLYVGLLNRELIQKFKRTRKYTGEDFDLLKEIVDWHSEVVTTPHVLAEVSNLANHLHEPARTQFFESFARSIAVLAETHTPATMLAQEPIFARLGLSDAAVARLAKDDSLLVVTADVDRYVHLLTIDVRVVNFNEATTVARFVEGLSL